MEMDGGVRIRWSCLAEARRGCARSCGPNPKLQRGRRSSVPPVHQEQTERESPVVKFGVKPAQSSGS